MVFFCVNYKESCLKMHFHFLIRFFSNKNIMFDSKRRLHFDNLYVMRSHCFTNQNMNEFGSDINN